MQLIGYLIHYLYTLHRLFKYKYAIETKLSGSSESVGEAIALRPMPKAKASISKNVFFNVKKILVTDLSRG